MSVKLMVDSPNNTISKNAPFTGRKNKIKKMEKR